MISKKLLSLCTFLPRPVEHSQHAQDSYSSDQEGMDMEGQKGTGGTGNVSRNK
jgi:hypothetical protein